VDGDSLEAALRDYGPAAMEDLLPRLLAIAEILDAAHASGQVHGRLHPRNIFVSADQTRVHGLDEATTDGEQPARPPYSAPELAAGGPAQPAADQFSLAAIAFEWMFGRRISGPAVRPIEVRTLPGVDRDALAGAFTRALAPQPADRFASCMAFCQALDAAVIPVLPLGGAGEEEDVLETRFLPEPVPSQPIDLDEIEPAPAAAPVLAQDAGRLESFEPRLALPVEPVTSWQPSSAYTPAKPAERFSGGMLIAACLVGMVVGFAAGYMARPRALQTGPVQTMAAPANGTEAAVSAPVAPTPVDGPAEAAPPGSPKKGLPPPAEVNAGRLLIRSTPSGASVEVDGVARGVTPLALRDLELGARTITISRRGYIADEQRVVLTPARPSRTLEVRLTQSAAPGRSGVASPTPTGTPATAGGLLVESRPPGATVTVNGTNRGTTPLTIEALAPGSYRVGLSLAGYRSFTTTVRVVAGERTRAAASLSVQE
jgi:serine/threonine-protein kinase